MTIKMLLVLVLAALSACGPMASGGMGMTVVEGLTGRLAGSVDPRAATEGAAPSVLTREAIEQQNVELLRVSIISREITSFVLLGGQNGSKVTWLSVDGLSLTLDGGLLVATRGFGDDLMGADVAAALRSLNGGGNHMRTLEFLDGLDQIERQVFECSTVATGLETITIVERSYATTVLEENCVGENATFKNTYWRDANGVIWQARQWISPLVGYLGYQKL